jgi:low affinity Fe/Cu permease
MDHSESRWVRFFRKFRFVCNVIWVVIWLGFIVVLGVLSRFLPLSETVLHIMLMVAILFTFFVLLVFAITPKQIRDKEGKPRDPREDPLWWQLD